jgi:hypothetical protein
MSRIISEGKDIMNYLILGFILSLGCEEKPKEAPKVKVEAK